ncbi:MAG: mechanosensitive ion channel domain-containing protein [Armatimonadota bacterium]
MEADATREADAESSAADASEDEVEEPAEPTETADEEPTPSPSTSSPSRTTRSASDAEATAAATRQDVRERRSEAISQSISQLSAEDVGEMSPMQKAALVGQIAQGARVELGALREETAEARLTLERLQQMAEEIARDRRVVPRQVRTGQIPGLGASNRWDALQETNAELQELIDRAFTERLRLLSDIPEAEDALDQVANLRMTSGESFDESVRQVLEDAEGYLGERLEAMQTLLELYNQQAAIATDAYDESSMYAEELSAAMVAARHRGLLARSDAGLSLDTFRAIGASLAGLPKLGDAVTSGYREEGRPPQTMLTYVLRLVGSALLLAALVLLWTKLPAWLASVFETDRNEPPRPDTDGGEGLQDLRQRRYVELLTPVARAAILAALAAVALRLWGLPPEWITATLAVLGTWAGYFALVAVLRELLAPRHAELRIVPIGSQAASAAYRLLRALALWSAIILPIIWALSGLEYQAEDVLVLLSVLHVVGLAIIAGWLIYAEGGPGEFIDGAEAIAADPLRRVAAIAVPIILGLVAAIAILKAVGYVNLGGYLARILYLELPLIIVALVLDWQIRRHFAAGSAWRARLRAGLWALVGVAQIPVLGLRWHHWLAIIDFLKRPLFVVAETEVSVFSIFRAIIVILIAWMIARFLRTWLSRSQRLRERFSEGLQYTLSSLTFYTILVIGILWAMLVGGFPLNALTVLAGMAGIGLGFGLQDMVSNFVAGLILLIERPLAVGDYVEVAGTWGRVTSISLRSTVVRTQSNVHILVPNGDIISSQLTNLSHHDLSLRIDVPIGVSYDADIDHVAEVLVEVANAHEDVSDFPEPKARLSDFGDSSINMLLMAWVSDPEGHKRIMLELNLEIWRALKREGIEIPFPQHDLHLREDSAPLRIAGGSSDQPGSPGEDQSQ